MSDTKTTIGDEIECPYCGYIQNCSYEFDGDSFTYTCEKCEKDSRVDREISVAYRAVGIAESFTSETMPG